MNIINKIMVGDCAEIMQRMPQDSVDLTVTSPPYDNLRTYKGFVFNFEDVAKGLYRITKPGGVVVWVVGDATIKGSETGTSFKQALYFKEIGFNLHDTMIYKKTSVLPMFPKAKRYNHSFEYMFIFSKGTPKTFNPKMVPKKEGVKYGGSGIRTRIYGNEETRQIKRSNSTEKLSDNIWVYNVGNNQSTKDRIAFQHPAIFPEQLAEDHILSWSNPGDVVFDPLCGSGTTLKMAKKNGRNFIGIDISQEYADLSQKRVDAV